MQFFIKNGHDDLGSRETGQTLDRIGVDCIDTGSLVPRTNRRKLRQILVARYGVHPTMVKWALKELGFWTPDRLGLEPKERQRVQALGIRA